MMIKDRNLNALWLRCILGELLHCGVRQAVLCPGGRAIMLCLAIANDSRFSRVIVQTDERSSGFIALGIAKAAQEPVIIVTTSGSAVANLVPVLTEAQVGRIPLILLTCDRPRHLRHTGFGQMTDHIGACQSFVVANLDLTDPSADESIIIDLRRKISSLLPYCTNASKRGVIHINIPLEGKQDPSEIQKGWQWPVLSSLALNGKRDELGNPIPMVPLLPEKPETVNLDEFVERLNLRPRLKGLILAGPDCSLHSAVVNDFACKVGYPVLADAASGLKRPAVENVVSGFDVLACQPGVRVARPDIIIRMGLSPVLPIVQDYILANPCVTLKISNTYAEKDFLHPTFSLLLNPSYESLLELAHRLGSGDKEWLQLWQKLSIQGATIRRQVVANLPWGEVKAACIVCNAEGYELLHLANSMSIRHANIYLEPTDHIQSVYSNRGVNGIDGTIGTFLGELIASQKRGLLLLGDQAFLHDLPALEAAMRTDISGTICVMNNGGGGIFDFLPAAKLPGYHDTIRHPTNINISAAAACFSLDYRACESANELIEAINWSKNEVGVQILEIKVAPKTLVSGTSMVYQSIMKSFQRPLAQTFGSAVNGQL